jgi:hypothetical protein
LFQSNFQIPSQIAVFFKKAIGLFSSAARQHTSAYVIICCQPRPDSKTTENFFESNPYFELKDESLEISLGKFFSNEFQSPAKCTICTKEKEKVYGGDIDIHSGTFIEATPIKWVKGV